MQNNSQEIRQALFEEIQKSREARSEELLGLLHKDGYRYEALKSLGKAESSSFSVEVEKEAMYYVALAQVFATLELIETLQHKD